MRQQWFTHVRLLVTHLTRSCRAFSATLTTSALDRRSLRWFGLPTCTASPEGQPPSLAQHGLCWRLLHRPHVPFRTHGLLTWSEIWCDVENSQSFRSSRDRRIFPGHRLKGASALHNFLASIFTAPSVTTWSDMSGKHQKEPGHQTRDTASPVDNVRSPGHRIAIWRRRSSITLDHDGARRLQIFHKRPACYCISSGGAPGA